MVAELPGPFEALEALEELECRQEAVVEVSEKMDRSPLQMLFLAYEEDDEKGDADAHHYNSLEVPLVEQYPA